MEDEVTAIDMNRWMLDEIAAQITSTTTIDRIIGLRGDLAIIDAHVGLICRDSTTIRRDRREYDARRAALLSRMDESVGRTTALQAEIAEIERGARGDGSR